VRISRAGGIYEAPSWSPDGRTILFAWRRCLTCVSTVRTVNADGTGERVLAGARRTTYSAAPRWSPLGTRIVDSWEGRVWTMGRDGSDRRRLTRGADVDWGPVWSPDGRRIAFLRSRPRQAVVSVVNADGSGLRSLDRTRGYSVAGSGRVVAWLP
jgi:Tol biopolymer transport system component